MSLLSILGFGNSKLRDVLKKGGVVIDVRTPHEFDQGHVKNSINIPVDRISVSVERIKQLKKPVIFCCASGSRSGTALRIVKSNGVKDVYNGGNWEKVARLLRSI
jgi:rhodanese-related sulfurtransferase